MKRIISAISVCCICLTLTLTCFSAEFVNPAVIDNAGYLDETELAELSALFEEIRHKYDFDVAVYTEDIMYGDDAMSTADDIFDYNGYGAGENDDGIMLYICSSSRKYHITTHADGLRIFNDNGIKYLMNNIEPCLSEDNYYLAIKQFALLSDELLGIAANGEPFNEDPDASTQVIIILGCGLILPLVLAFTMTNAKLAKMKTAVANNYAANYIKPGSKDLKVSRDIFLYSNVIKTEKPKSDTTSHKSSSGRTHGGGGGSF